MLKKFELDYNVGTEDKKRYFNRCMLSNKAQYNAIVEVIAITDDEDLKQDLKNELVGIYKMIVHYERCLRSANGDKNAFEGDEKDEELDVKDLPRA